jgi:hypothetical protein
MSAKRLLSFTVNATSFGVFGTATLNSENATPSGTCSEYFVLRRDGDTGQGRECCASDGHREHAD